MAPTTRRPTPRGSRTPQGTSRLSAVRSERRRKTGRIPSTPRRKIKKPPRLNPITPEAPQKLFAQQTLAQRSPTLDYLSRAEQRAPLDQNQTMRSSMEVGNADQLTEMIQGLHVQSAEPEREVEQRETDFPDGGFDDDMDIGDTMTFAAQTQWNLGVGNGESWGDVDNAAGVDDTPGEQDHDVSMDW